MVWHGTWTNPAQHVLRATISAEYKCERSSYIHKKNSLIDGILCLQEVVSASRTIKGLAHEQKLGNCGPARSPSEQDQRSPTTKAQSITHGLCLPPDVLKDVEAMCCVAKSQGLQDEVLRMAVARMQQIFNNAP